MEDELYNLAIKELWEFMRRLNVRNECPQFNIDDCKKSLQISNDIFNHAYDVLKKRRCF